MKRVAAVLLAFVGLPVIAAAQTVDLRSGEHGEFTRLVLDAPADTDWTMERNPGRLEILLDLPGAEVRSEQVFDRIDRTRIRSVRAEGPRLSVELGCACTVTAFRAGSRMIVFDIYGAETRSPGTAALAGHRLSFGSDVLILPEAGSRAFRFRAEHLGQGSPARPADEPAEAEVARVPGPVIESGVLTDTFPGQQDSAALGEIGRDLLRQVSRATAQGLLTPQSGFPTVPAAVPSPARIERDIAIEIPTNNVRAISAVDMARPGQPAGAMSGLLGRCLDDRHFDLLSWAAPGAQLLPEAARLRSGLFGEFDRIDTAKALDLARLYLHFGFGAEARQILDLLPDQTPDIGILRLVGRIVDDGVFEGTNPLAGQESCDGRVAFWALMAQDPIDPARVPDEIAVTRSLNELPGPLRQHLGAILARRLLAANHGDLARSVLRLAGRATSEPSEGLDMAGGELMMRDGRTTEAAEAFVSVAARDGPLGPEALIALVAARWQEDEALEPGTADSIDALLEENSGLPIAPALHRALVVAHALEGDFNRAQEAYSTAQRRSDAGGREKLDAMYYDVVARRTGADGFLVSLFSADGDVARHVATDTGNRIAERLIEAGFPERSQPFLERGAEGAAGRKRRMLRARAALMLDRPRTAEAELLGVTGADADLLRGLSRRAAGDFAAAVEFLERAGDTQRAMDVAREGGLWEEARRLDALITRDRTGESAPAPATPPAPQVGTEEPRPEAILAAGRDLIESSRTARDALDALLDETRLIDQDG